MHHVVQHMEGSKYADYRRACRSKKIPDVNVLDLKDLTNYLTVSRDSFLSNHIASLEMSMTENDLQDPNATSQYVDTTITMSQRKPVGNDVLAIRSHVDNRDFRGFVQRSWSQRWGTKSLRHLLRRSERKLRRCPLDVIRLHEISTFTCAFSVRHRPGYGHRSACLKRCGSGCCAKHHGAGGALTRQSITD